MCSCSPPAVLTKCLPIKLHRVLCSLYPLFAQMTRFAKSHFLALTLWLKASTALPSKEPGQIKTMLLYSVLFVSSLLFHPTCSLQHGMPARWNSWDLNMRSLSPCLYPDHPLTVTSSPLPAAIHFISHFAKLLKLRTNVLHRWHLCRAPNKLSDSPSFHLPICPTANGAMLSCTEKFRSAENTISRAQQPPGNSRQSSPLTVYWGNSLTPKSLHFFTGTIGTRMLSWIAAVRIK